MSSMPWIKLWTDILDDPKMGRLTKPVKWRFVELCLLAGECDAEGYLVNGNEALEIRDICWRLRADASELVEDMEMLQSVGLLCQDDDGSWFVTNFSQRQGRPQHEKREQWRERKQRQREREQEGEGPGTDEEQDVTPENVTRESPVTPGLREETEESKSREDHTGKPVVTLPDGLSEGQKLFLAAFGAKRFKTNIQKAAVLALEREHGTDVLSEGVQWAAKQGMNMGKAVLSLETALPKWGKPRSGDVLKVSGL